MLTYYTFSQKIPLNEVQCNPSSYCSIGKSFLFVDLLFPSIFFPNFIFVLGILKFEYDMPSVVSLLFSLLVHLVSEICGLVSIINFGKFLATITSNMLSAQFSLSSSTIPVTCATSFEIAQFLDVLFFFFFSPVLSLAFRFKRFLLMHLHSH